MTPRPSPALREALALMRTPRGARPGPDERLPQGTELLVRIVGGDGQALADAVRITGEPDSTVRDAAAFYIQQVMFASGSDSYRVLGLDPSASDEQLKSHHRWLTRWLHPDRNRDEWEAIYSERVNRAWQDLRNSERRQRYDQTRTGSTGAGPVHLAKQTSTGRVMHLQGAEPGLSLRWLPHAIFGGLGLSAVAIVALYYALRFSSQPPEFAAAPTQADRPFESSALANPRIAQGKLQVPAAEVPKSLATNPVAEHPEPVSSMTLASAIPLPSKPAEAAVLPAARPPAAVPSAPVAMKQVSLPTPEPVTRRQEPPKQTQEASASSEAARPVEQRVLPAISAPVAKAEVREASQAAPFSQREANRIMGRFSEVYADGDLAGMRAMFTSDATSPDGGLDAILDEYDRLFGRSKHRLLSVQDVNWTASGKTFTIVASYEATMKTGLLTRTRSQGRLRMEMRQVNDQWLIYRLEHNERND